MNQTYRPYYPMSYSSRNLLSRIPINIKNVFKRGIKNYEQIISAFQNENFKELKEVTLYDYYPNTTYAFLHKEENNATSLTILYPSSLKLYLLETSIKCKITHLSYGYTQCTIKNIHLGTRYIHSHYEKAIEFLENMSSELIKNFLFSDVIFTTEQSGNLIFALLYIEISQQLYKRPLPMATDNLYQWDKYLLGSRLEECVLLSRVSLP